MSCLMSRLKMAAVVVFLVCGLGVSAAGVWANAVMFERGRIVMRTADGKRHMFSVEIAKTPEAHARGLMFREKVPPGTGMLFIFTPPTEVRFWMKDTPVSLDMIFIRENGSVAGIARDTVPGDTTLISSGEKVRYVLEVAAGQAHKLGIDERAELLMRRKN